MEKPEKSVADGYEKAGRRLLKALAEAGLTQAQLAERIGRTQAAVSQWCSDEKTPTPANISLIAQTLGISPSWLESGFGPMRVVNHAAQREEYQREAFWGFRPAPPDGGRDYGNANVWSFE